MATLRELIESTTRSAEAVLRLSAAVEKLIPAFEQIRRDVYDMKNDRETDGAKQDIALSKLNTDLAVLLDNIKSTQGDLKQVQRDVTGSQALQKREPSKPKVVLIVETFERLHVSTKIVLFVLVVIAALSGWLTHLLKG